MRGSRASYLGRYEAGGIYVGSSGREMGVTTGTTNDTNNE